MSLRKIVAAPLDGDSWNDLSFLGASLVSAGVVVATKPVHDIWAGASFDRAQVAGHADLVLRLEASDGQRADIPLPDGVVPPRPTIETITYDGTTLTFSGMERIAY